LILLPDFAFGEAKGCHPARCRLHHKHGNALPALFDLEGLFKLFDVIEVEWKETVE
jgi:hypothetical protein